MSTSPSWFVDASLAGLQAARVAATHIVHTSGAFQPISVMRSRTVRAHCLPVNLQDVRASAVSCLGSPPPRRVGHNLLLRLNTCKHDVLRFLTDPAVPFTNNLAEQDGRMMKLRQKISGGLRSEGGAHSAVIRKQLDRVAEAAHRIFADAFEIEIAIDKVGERA